MATTPEEVNQGSELEITIKVSSEYERLLTRLSKMLGISIEAFSTQIIKKELNYIRSELKEHHFDFISKYFTGSYFEQVIKDSNIF